MSRPRRLALPLAGVALLALAAFAAGQLLRPADQLTTAQQAERIAAGLRCPDCQALSVAESRTAAAAAIHDEITAQLAAGRTPDQVRAHFVERYGEWILLSPDDPLAWWLPAVVLAAGVAAFMAWLLVGRPPRSIPAAEPGGPDDLHRQRVRDELEAQDG